jgi:transitional endoplasmic reticulum ATPase
MFDELHAKFSKLTFDQVDETATAILKKKKKPNSLTVTDASNDDNSAYLRGS